MTALQAQILKVLGTAENKEATVEKVHEQFGLYNTQLEVFRALLQLHTDGFVVRREDVTKQNEFERFIWKNTAAGEAAL